MLVAWLSRLMDTRALDQGNGPRLPCCAWLGKVADGPAHAIRHHTIPLLAPGASLSGVGCHGCRPHVLSFLKRPHELLGHASQPPSPSPSIHSKPECWSLRFFALGISFFSFCPLALLIDCCAFRSLRRAVLVAAFCPRILHSFLLLGAGSFVRHRLYHTPLRLKASKVDYDRHRFNICSGVVSLLAQSFFCSLGQALAIHKVPISLAIFLD